MKFLYFSWDYLFIFVLVLEPACSCAYHTVWWLLFSSREYFLTVHSGLVTGCRNRNFIFPSAIKSFRPETKFFCAPLSMWTCLWNFYSILYSILRVNWIEKYNTLQWITWLGGRWRTQLTARRHVNCRTCEHRHFERILRTVTRLLSMSGSGSVKSNQKVSFFLHWAFALSKVRGFKMNKNFFLPQKMLTLGIYFLSWVSRSKRNLIFFGSRFTQQTTNKKMILFFSTWD